MPKIDYLKSLNAEQREAVVHGTENGKVISKDPLLVIAGPGSVKTKTLAHSVAHLIVCGVDPQRILLLTFTRRAAEEMTRRVERITAAALGVGSVELPWAGTFHSVGARLLREFASQIGLRPSFTIHDRSDSADLMDMVRHQLGFADTEQRFPRKETCLAIYSLSVNARERVGKVLARQYPAFLDWKRELKKLFAEYANAKQAQNVLDYDDLLLCWAAMMQNREIAAELDSRFQHVLVDEYQDTNLLQSAILLGLKPEGHGLMVVGDDAQSIYSFRAATVRNILDFPNQFERKAHIAALSQNYRSTQPILVACNAIMGLAKEGFRKELWSARKSKQRPRLVTVGDVAAQAQYIAEQILKAREEGVPLKQQAALFRASSHSAQLEIELARRNIPFKKYGGLKFLEAAHVKDVLSILRWCENATDRVAGFRVVQLLPGIGPTTAAKILDSISHSSNAAERLRGFKVPKAAAEDWPAFVKLISRVSTAKKTWPAEFEWVKQWYEPHLHQLYDDAAIRAADLEQLQQIAGTYPTRRKFLTELTLDPPDATGHSQAGNKDEDYTILSTIHSAKGQEWKAVRILNVIDGCIPSDRATGTPEEIEEERRLLFVAMSRAKDELDLIVPQRFFLTSQSAWGDRHVYASVSRFIPKSIQQHFECRAWKDRRNAGETTAKDSTARVNVLAQLQGMWR